MPLSNRAPVNAAGQIMVTTVTPVVPTWPVLGGMTYHPTTGELAVIDAVPPAGEPWVGGIRFTNLGSMYVWSAALPAGVEYVGGIPVTDDGRVVVDGSGGAGGIVVGGWPIGSGGGVPVVGLSAQPIFWSVLTNTLVPVIAGNPAFTFTRATTAYVADNEGILRNAIAGESRFQGARRVRNVSLKSQAFTGADGWTNTTTGAATLAVTNNVGVAPDGTTTAARFLASNPAADLAFVRCSATTSLGVNSIWVKSNTGANQSFSLGAVDNAMTTLVATSVWQRFATAPKTGGFLGVSIVTPAATSLDLLIWGAQTEDVSGQSNQAPGDYVSVGVLAAPYHGNAIDGVKYFATTNGNSVVGNVVTEATGSLIPTATMLGYVAENAATNLCLQSQTFDAWSVAAVVVTPNTQAAPDGTLTADVLADNATSAVHAVFIGTTRLATTQYTYSVYLKAGTLTWTQILANEGGQNNWANFNLVTGVVGNVGAGTTATITALPNGWYRCTITFTTGAAGSGNVQVLASNANSAAASPTYVGTGQTMYLWGAQVEAGSDPSSYMPTTTAAVVRNGESLLYALASNLAAGAATMYGEPYFPVAAPGTYQVSFYFTVGGINQLFHLSTKTFSLNSQVVVANARVLGAVNKHAAAWNGTAASACLNGGAVATGTVAAMPTTGSIEVGSQTGGLSVQGSIRNVKFFSSRLSDAELVTMTGP